MAAANDRAAETAAALIRECSCRDPFRIAAMRRIGVKYINTRKQKGFCKIILGNPFVFINRNMSEQMQKMTCAHELGHLFLHADLLAERQYLLEYELFDIQNETEYEANLFAADLLIDEDELMELLAQSKDMVSIASSLDINVNLLMIKMIEMHAHDEAVTVPYVPERKFMGRIEDKAGQ